MDLVNILLTFIASSSFSAILISTYWFFIKRSSLKIFLRDPSIKKVQLGKNHQLERTENQNSSTPNDQNKDRTKA